MIGLFDCNFISILFNDKARIPKSRAGVPVVPNAQARIDLLVSTLSKDRSKIIIPSPALAEFMLLADDRWPQYLALIRRKAVFEIAGFNDAEAVVLVQACLQEGKLRARSPSAETWAKMKYDRQIVAIAKTHRVQSIYSTDADVHRLAKKADIKCFDLIDLPSPGPKQLVFTDGDVQADASNIVEISSKTGEGSHT